jgi:hypothetical protein
MVFYRTTDYAIGKIVEFHLRALRVLRGSYLPSARRLSLEWRNRFLFGAYLAEKLPQHNHRFGIDPRRRAFAGAGDV